MLSLGEMSELLFRLAGELFCVSFSAVLLSVLSFADSEDVLSLFDSLLLSSANMLLIFSSFEILLSVFSTADSSAGLLF